MAVRTVAKRGQAFMCKKWLLFLFTFLANVLITFFMIVLSIEINQNYEQSGRYIAIILGVGCAMLLVHIIGIVGTLKEHYCLVMSYSVTIAAKAGILIVLAIVLPITWIIIAILMMVSCLAYFYAKDIQDMKSVPPYHNGRGQPNIVYVMSDYTYPVQNATFPPAPPYFAHDNCQQNAPVLFPTETIEPDHLGEAPPPYSSENQRERPKFVDIDLT